MPFSAQPEGYSHGLPQHYATAMPVRGSAIPLIVKVIEGRPVKIEGNPEHPINHYSVKTAAPYSPASTPATTPGETPVKHGPTDTFAQASVLGLYDPDRAQRFTHQGQTVPREAALDCLARTARAAEAAGGRGLCFLAGRSSSPSRARLQRLLRQKLPFARWFEYEAVDFDIHRQAATLAFGRAVRPYFRLDLARRVLSLDCDFLGGEEDSYRTIWDFARTRCTETLDEMSRLYVVESLLTITGANADHRLRARPSDFPAIAARLAQEVFASLGWRDWLPKPPPRRLAPTCEQWVVECARDLLANQGCSLVVAGHRQPIAAHLLAHALNQALGNIGKTVLLYPALPPEAESLDSLANALRASEIETLVILGSNPVYDAPVDLDWPALQRRARIVIRLGPYEDESFAGADWHLPQAHFLESWGDARTADGTVVPIQPLIEPLFGGLTELEVMARLGSMAPVKPYDIVRETLRELVGENAGAGPLAKPALEEVWNRFLHDGFLAGSKAEPVAAKLGASTLDTLHELMSAWAAKASAVPAESGSLEVVFARDYRVDDGRYANNGWLQELPDPITKITWDNVILLSPQTARELGVPRPLGEGNRLQAAVAAVELNGRAIEGPTWVQPGLADGVVGLLLGYGRASAGRVGKGVGYNAYLLRTTQALHSAGGAKLSLRGGRYPLACTQPHSTTEGHGPAGVHGEAEAGFSPYHPSGQADRSARAVGLNRAGRLAAKRSAGEERLYQDPLDVPDAQGFTPKQKARHWWGMVIDLNACVGCSTCVLACQSENNVPIVGKDQVGRRREMHWLRLDRYYVGPAADPQVAYWPVMCQHCEAAPCESVCPVNATVHDPEGLNVMVYSRCIGSRFCSNNCPYKVRRFNYFDYNRHPLDQLYRSPITTSRDGEWELKRWLKDRDRGSRPQDEWDLLQLARNPDVTVRMRGVMEKCTYCVQRLELAKIAQLAKAGPSPPGPVPDGTVMTACQQACPAGAIVFGNLKDPSSRVTRLKAREGAHVLLESLGTRPRTTYLARRRNLNPAMPLLAREGS